MKSHPITILLQMIIRSCSNASRHLETMGMPYGFRDVQGPVFRSVAPLVIAASFTQDVGQSGKPMAPGWELLSSAEVAGAPVIPGAAGEGDTAILAFGALEPMQKTSTGDSWTSATDAAGGKESVPARWIRQRGRLIAAPGRAAGGAGQPAVAGYTIQPGAAGFYRISDSFLVRSADQPGRVEVRVFVRPAGALAEHSRDPVVYASLGGGEAFDFDAFLGYLDAGDTVYVSVGSAGEPTGDQTMLDYRIGRIPAIDVSAFPEDLNGDGRTEGLGNWRLVSGNDARSDALTEGPFRVDGSSAKLRWDAGTLPDASGAKAVFRVPHTGYYALAGAWASGLLPDSGDVEMTISVGDEMKRKVQISPKASEKVSLNTDLGYVEKGDAVTLKFVGGGRTEQATEVEFRASVVEWAPRRAPIRVNRGEDGYLDVYEPHAARIAIDIPAEHWITVPAQEGDATGSIRDAFAKAMAARSGDAYVGVRLEPGKSYTVGSSQTGGALFSFEGTQRIVFDGRGSKLLIASPEFARKSVDLFRVVDSRSLVFADLVVEDASLPYTVGEVLAINPPSGNTQTVTFKVEPGNPGPIADIRRDGIAGGYAYDPLVPGRLGLGVWSHFPGSGSPHIQATDDPGVFTHRVTRTGDSIRTGMKWLIKNKGAGVNYLVTRGTTEDVTLWKIEGRACGGGMLRFWGTSGINILDSRFEPIDNRWISSTADGVHGRGREGVWIEDTVIRGICEDVMNTYGLTFAIAEDSRVDDNVFSVRLFGRSDKAPGGRELRLPGKDEIELGDSLLFFNPKTGKVIGKAQVTAIADGRYTLSSPIEGVESWEPKDGKEATMVYNTTSVARFYVRDSRVMDSMRFGIYIKAQEGVIFNNHFEGLSGPSVFAVNEPEWPEGPPPSYIWVQGNTFSQNNTGYMSRHRDFVVVDPAEISVYTRRFRGSSEPDDFRAHITREQFANSHIKIVGNTFHDWRGMGIAVRNSRNVLISDNLFLPPVDDPVMRATLGQDPLLANGGKGSYAAIFLDSVEGARVTRNHFEGLPQGDRMIVLGPDAKHVLESGSTSSDGAHENLDVSLGFSEWFGAEATDAAPSGAVSDRVDVRGAARQVGRLGAGLGFDGTGARAVLASSSDLLGKRTPAFSLALWVCPKMVSEASQIIYSQADAPRGVAVAIVNGRLSAGLWQDKDGAWLDLGPALVGVWQHVALVFDGSSGTLRGFRDGAELSSVSMGVPAAMEPIESDGIFGGAMAPVKVNAETLVDTGQGGYSGAVDEFRLFNRAVEPREIGLIARGLTPVDRRKRAEQ